MDIFSYSYMIGMYIFLLFILGIRYAFFNYLRYIEYVRVIMDNIIGSRRILLILGMMFKCSCLGYCYYCGEYLSSWGIYYLLLVKVIDYVLYLLCRS
jgi:hypothetical protein